MYSPRMKYVLGRVDISREYIFHLTPAVHSLVKAVPDS